MRRPSVRQVFALLALLALVLVLVVAPRTRAAARGATTTLTARTFDDFVARDDDVVVMAMAPWCGACARMKPAFEAAAAAGRGGVAFGVVDADAEASVARTLDLKHFPTIVRFRRGERVAEYEGGPDVEALRAFARA